jgi:hypothetical protein
MTRSPKKDKFRFFHRVARLWNYGARNEENDKKDKKSVFVKNCVFVGF